MELQDEKKEWYDNLKLINYFTNINIYTKDKSLLTERVVCRLTWKEKHVILIHEDGLQFYKYFSDYFDIINMLELNGVKLVEGSRPCDCFSFCDCENCVHDYEYMSHIFVKCSECEDQIICDAICECNKYIYYSLHGKYLYYYGIRYNCSYKNIREELKDVIDEILSKNKVISNQ